MSDLLTRPQLQLLAMSKRFKRIDKKVGQMTSRTRFIVIATILVAASACSGTNSEVESLNLASTDNGLAQDEDQPEITVERPAVTSAPPAGSDVTDRTVDGAADGVTSMNRSLGGSAYSIGLDLKDIAAIADVGLDATVIDIRPGILNTPSGEWDPNQNTPPNVLHDNWSLLAPYTVVELRVERVLGARRNFEVAAPGDHIEVWLLGGTITLTLSAEDAHAIGLDGDVDPADEDLAALTDSVAAASPISGALVRTIQMAHAVSFEEGDRLLIFGRMGNRPANSEAIPASQVFWSLVPQGAGIFVSNSSDDTMIDAATSQIVNRDLLVEVARSLTNTADLSRPFNGSSTPPEAPKKP